MFNSQANHQGHEQEQISQLPNQYLLNNFPLVLHDQFSKQFKEEEELKSSAENINKKVHMKVSCIIRHLLSKVKSKKQGFEIAKNIQFINDSKGEQSSKQTIKTLMKLKMTKATIQREQVLNICHGLAMNVILGTKNSH